MYEYVWGFLDFLVIIENFDYWHCEVKVKISKYQVGEQKFDQFLKPEWFFSIKLVSKAIHFQVMGCGRAEIQKRNFRVRATLFPNDENKIFNVI